jgi:hypothetical protein
VVQEECEVINCCCATGQRWLAQKCCDGSCVGTCPDSEEECNCYLALTFCDDYRAAQGMPARMEPSLCYWWFHNGCRYIVLGAQDIACLPIADTPHNEGTYAGATERPLNGTCDDACAELCPTQGLYHVPPAPWDPDCNCGAQKTLSFDSNGALCCGCDCLPLAEACSRICPGPTLFLSLTQWPLGWRPASTACTNVVNSCDSCLSTGNADSDIAYINFNAEVGSNYCDQNCPDVDPCDGTGQCNDGGVGRACTAAGSFSIFLTGNTSEQYEFGFSVTRSCPEGSCNDPPNWFFGAPTAGSPAVQICDCSAGPGKCVCCGFIVPQNPGTNAEELAKVINQYLGSNSAACVTYQAEGKREAWLGNSYACIPDNNGDFPSTNPCHQCVFEPSTWIGPFYSDCNKKVTFLYKPTYVYGASCDYGCSNYTFFSQNNQRCQCTGSNLGAVGGAWTTLPNGGEVFKYGGQCPSVGTFVPLPGSAPCLGLPSIS